MVWTFFRTLYERTVENYLKINYFIKSKKNIIFINFMLFYAKYYCY